MNRMDFFSFIKIGILPLNFNLLDFNYEFSDKNKKKYGINEIKIINEENKKELLNNIFYVSNKKISEVLNGIKRAIIFLFPYEYHFNNEKYIIKNLLLIILYKNMN